MSSGLKQEVFPETKLLQVAHALGFWGFLHILRMYIVYTTLSALGHKISKERECFICYPHIIWIYGRRENRKLRFTNVLLKACDVY